MGVVGDGIKADDEVRVAKLTLMLLHVEYKVIDLALLATLNRDNDSWVAASKILTRFYRQNCREERISIVVRSTPI